MLTTKRTAGQADTSLGDEDLDMESLDGPTFAGSLDFTTASIVFSSLTEVESVLARAESASAETRLGACHDILVHLDNSAVLSPIQQHQLAHALTKLGDDPEDSIRTLARTVLPPR